MQKIKPSSRSHSLRMHVMISSTRVDSHGEQPTVEFLQSAARQTNGDRAVAMGVQHDCTVPPRGKLRHARVVKGVGGKHFDLLAEELLLDEPTPCGLEFDGEELFRQGSKDDGRGFYLARAEDDPGFVISVNPRDFDTPDSYEAFRRVVESDGGTAFRRQLKKANEPEIATMVIHVADAIAAYLFSKDFAARVFSKTGDSLGADLDWLYRAFKSSVGSGLRWAATARRTKMVCVVIQKAPLVEVVVKAADPDGLLNPLLPASLQQAVAKANEIRSLIAAEQIQLVHSPQGWKLGFVLTARGEVIGRQATFEHRRLLLLEMKNSGLRIGGSIGATVDFE